jgi:hypothetical protein
MIRDSLSPETREQMAKLYECGADRLEVTGWQQHQNGTKDGPNCLQGAIFCCAEQMFGRVSELDEPYDNLPWPKWPTDIFFRSME